MGVLERDEKNVANRGFYVGIDMDDEYAVASFYETGMKEPATVSTIAGSEVFQIPMQIAKKAGQTQWAIGEEAERVAEEEQALLIDHLLGRAESKEEIIIEEESYTAEELLFLFLKKLISYAGVFFGTEELKGLAFSVERLNTERSKLLLRLGEKLGVHKKQLMLLDRKSAYYYFVLNQPKELWLHDVYLFDCRDTVIKCICMHRNRNTIPQLITMEEKTAVLAKEGRDEAFLQLLQECLKGHIVSSVYLVGEAFEGGWMKLSLAYMCRGRRAFMGKNLYAKGACHAVMVTQQGLPWQYIYLGDNEVKVNVSLKVKNRGADDFVSLLSVGDNCYEAEGECEVILDDTKEVDIWLQLADSRVARIEKLLLFDLPERENKMTRLRITATPVSDVEIKVQIKDLGFGEIVKSSNLSWEYTMSM